MAIYKRIYLEITNICNLNCSFCPITERDKQFMALDQFEHAISQVAPLAEQVCLHLMGEPLAHPNLEGILNICQKYNCPVQLTTNGLLLTRHTDLILNTKCIRQVNISAQSYMDNFPNKDFTTYLEKIYLFIDTAFNEREDMYLNIRLWNIEETHSDQNEPIFQFLEEKLDVEINRKLELGKIKSKKLKHKLYLHFDSRFDWPRLELPFQSKTGRCNGLIDHLAIHADGTVVPCCLDDQKIINLGNINSSHLEDIINSPRATAIANGFRNNQLVEDLCQRCSYINRFKK